jgi:hypothetical protein
MEYRSVPEDSSRFPVLSTANSAYTKPKTFDRSSNLCDLVVEIKKLEPQGTQGLHRATQGTLGTGSYSLVK